MERSKIILIVEIVAGISFLIASLFLSNITAFVINTPPVTNEKFGFFIASLALVLTALFIWMKWKK